MSCCWISFNVNKIILGAPATTNNLFCFRGSSSDYVVQNTTYTDETGVINVFLTNSRPSSISFNFNAALDFYKMGQNPDNRTMYRVLVTPGCKLLFVAPLSHANTKYEMEFLIPLHHVFTSYNLFTRVKAYNSFNNHINICLHQNDKLNSKDIVLLPI